MEVDSQQSKQRVFRTEGVEDVVVARRYSLETALEVGFHQADATKIAVVVSELGRNIERYAGTGTITVTTKVRPSACVMIVAEDHGPGIPNLDRVLMGGYTTSKGLGLGLSGSKRLMDLFDVQSAMGVGTTIKAIKWLIK